MTGLELYALRVDGVDTPQGVVAAPSFSWRLRCERRGARQSSYRVRVTQLGAGGSLVVWDSGRVASAETAAIVYRGAPLVSSTAYTWTVEVEDADGAASEASGTFGTGIVHPDEWSAAWIGRNPVFRHTSVPPQDTDISYTVNKLQPVRRFVHRFELDAVPVAARIHASAQGIYRLYVNGVRVGADELVPGWTEYRDRITYQSHDVAPLLRAGENVIAALLGDGWYVGFIGTDRRHQAQHYGTEPALLVQLDIDDATGARHRLATGDGWRESASDIIYADMLMGQYEDSRRAEPTWNLVEHDTSDWTEAAVVSTDTTRLVPEIDPAVRVTERLGAVSVTRRDEGRFVVDFGQNLVGRVKITLRDQPSGTRIQLVHAEVLDGEGDLYTANLRTAEPVDVFWTDGSAVQVFEPRFTLHGFRFAEVSGLVGDLAAADVEALVLHNDFEVAGDVVTSSPDLNQLVSNIRWGLRGNFVSIPTDCPQRDERLGWVADAQVFAPTALALADVAPLLRRWLLDVRSAQMEDGAFRDIAPRLIHMREGAPAWGDGGVTIPWAIYRATGDGRVLADAVDSMVRWVRRIERHNPDLLWRERVGNNYGDWLQVNEETPKDVLATAYFARSARIAADTLALLDRPGEAAEMSALADRIRDSYRAAFVGADGTVTGDTQGAYLLTLAFGLHTPAEEPLLAERLVASIERRGVALTTGFVTVGLLCPVLTRIGRSDLAYALVLRDEYPSWLFSVRNGATTIWERWDGWTADAGFQSPRMNSFNHYSLGAVGEWLFTGIAGIDQQTDSAGFRGIHLAPQFDAALTGAAGWLETPRGRIESAWQRQDDEISWTVRIPPGEPALADIPVATASTITEGGETITRSEGATLQQERPGSTRLYLESGSYHFRFPAGASAAALTH